MQRPNDVRWRIRRIRLSEVRWYRESAPILVFDAKSVRAALSRIVPRRHFFENFGRAWSFSAWIERWVGRKTTYGGGAVEILRGHDDVFQPWPPLGLIAPPRGLPSVRDFSIDWEDYRRLVRPDTITSTALYCS